MGANVGLKWSNRVALRKKKYFFLVRARASYQERDAI